MNGGASTATVSVAAKSAGERPMRAVVSRNASTTAAKESASHACHASGVRGRPALARRRVNCSTASPTASVAPSADRGRLPAPSATAST